MIHTYSSHRDARQNPASSSKSPEDRGSRADRSVSPKRSSAFTHDTFFRPDVGKTESRLVRPAGDDPGAGPNGSSQIPKAMTRQANLWGHLQASSRETLTVEALFERYPEIKEWTKERSRSRTKRNSRIRALGENRLFALHEIVDCINTHRSHLNLAGLGLTQTPPFLQKICPHIESLDLIENELDEIADDTWAGLANLQKLSLAGNKTLRTLPREIFDLSNLRTLDASSCALEDLPENLQNCHTLEVLRLSENQLSHLPEIEGCVNLHELEIDTNRLRALPDGITRCSNLIRLEASCNELAELPPDMGRLRRLQSLALGQNELKSLPPEIFDLPDLRALDASSCRLTELPSNLGSCTTLEILRLANNSLRHIPEIGTCVHLQELDIASNDVQFLPNGITQCQNLTTLNACSNRLKELPHDMESLRLLETVYLDNNADLRALPDSLSELPNAWIAVDHDLQNRLESLQHSSAPEPVASAGTDAAEASFVSDNQGIFATGWISDDSERASNKAPWEVDVTQYGASGRAIPVLPDFQNQTEHDNVMQTLGLMHKHIATGFEYWRCFDNDQNHLPAVMPDGKEAEYVEYRVAPPDGKPSPGSWRIVMNTLNRQTYLTIDHYGDNNFWKPVRPAPFYALGVLDAFFPENEANGAQGAP